MARQPNNFMATLQGYLDNYLDERFNKKNRFGDVAANYGNEMLNLGKTFAGNAGDISFSGFREAAPEMLTPYIRGAAYLPDMGAAGLLSLIGLGEKGIAALAEGIAGGTASEDRLARDLLGMAEVAGVNPQGRLAGILAPYVQSYMKGRMPDYEYAAKSLLQGDLGGVREAFTETDMLPRAVGADITSYQQDPQYLQDFGNPETTAKFYSPSLRAAQNLPQNKGSYEQLRNWMITKGGAKPEELEFSGADRLFNMKQVTKQEIIDYLENNDPSLKSYTLSSADGATGKPMVVDFSEARDQIEQDEPLMSQIESEYIDRMAEDMGYQFASGEDFISLSDLHTEGVHEGAYTIDEIVNDFNVASGSLANTGQAEKLRAMLENYQKTLKKYNETGFHGDKPTDEFIVRVGDDFTFAMDEVDAVEKMSGGYENIRSAARDEYFDLLEYEFDQDPIEFAEVHGLGGGQTNFKRGETRHAEYFPAGGYNYNESMIRFEDPTGMIDAEDLPKTHHHGADDAGTVMHMRQADFEGGRLDRDRIRYIGEIQLDANRRMMDSFMVPTPRENLINLSKARKDIQDLSFEAEELSKKRYRAFDAFNDKMLLRGIDGKLENAAMFAMIKRYNKLHKSPDGQRMSPNIPFIDEEEWLKTKGIGDVSILNRLEDVAPYQLAPQNLHRLIREPLDYKYKKELLDAYIEIAKHDNPNGYQDEDFVKAIMQARKADEASQTAFDKINKERKKILDKYDAKGSDNTLRDDISAKYGYGTNAPMLDSRNKQIDFAIRKSLLDAANDEYVDFVAFPDDVGAIGSVGGSTNPEQGTIDFYQQNVQNRLKSVLKKIDKGLDKEIEDISVSQQDFENEFMDGGDFNARGVRMTPELRKKLIEKGLPSFGVAGGVGLMNFMVQNNKDGRDDRLLTY